MIFQSKSFGTEKDTFSNVTYCVELREAFKGIELNADSNDVERIRMQLEKSRHKKKASSSNKAFDFLSSERQNKLHWTIQPCNTPTKNLYICEKSTGHYSPTDKHKETQDHYGNDKKQDNGNIFLLIV